MPSAASSEANLLKLETHTSERDSSCTSFFCPVNGVYLHVVSDKHSLLDLLEQSTHAAYQVCPYRCGCQRVITTVQPDCYKIGLLADDLQVTMTVEKPDK